VRKSTTFSKNDSLTSCTRTRQDETPYGGLQPRGMRGLTREEGRRRK
jgi:hypothetical protein